MKNLVKLILLLVLILLVFILGERLLPVKGESQLQDLQKLNQKEDKLLDDRHRLLQSLAELKYWKLTERDRDSLLQGLQILNKQEESLLESRRGLLRDFQAIFRKLRE